MMGYTVLGAVPQWRGHVCDLPGRDGLPDVAADGSAVWRAEGQVIRCDCGRAWVLRFSGWRRAHWWTLRRLGRG